ncbi:hypothetical protein KPH14_001011 [Odynerus spinipes]|uniref:Uncharacterized protein n=1 Tax=Odynerus spinipes TaxID=1348599 RepID=A0AAD9RC93_9HYME|nr:hypothetical protein KPH14_001011 [Odynerus spinipes]
MRGDGLVQPSRRERFMQPYASWRKPIPPGDELSLSDAMAFLYVESCMSSKRCVSCFGPTGNRDRHRSGESSERSRPYERYLSGNRRNSSSDYVSHRKKERHDGNGGSVPGKENRYSNYNNEIDSPSSQDSRLEVPLNVLDSGPSLPSATDDAVEAGVAEAALKDSQEVFGDRLVVERVLTLAIHKDIAVKWEEIVKKGLPAEERKTLLNKYSPRINCTFINPPRINLEVKAAVDSKISKRDDRVSEKQEMIGAALAGIGKELTFIRKSNFDGKIAQLESLNNAARLLTDLQRDETEIRRSLILKNIKASFTDTLKDTTPGEWLFGKDISEKLIAAGFLQQSSKDLKTCSKIRSESDRGSYETEDSYLSYT